LKTAKEKGLTISFDLNYRKKLWTSEQAQKTIKKLAPFVDVCIGNEEDIEKTLGYKPNSTDVVAGKLDIEGYKKIFAQVKKDFGFKYVTSTLRKSYSASDNGWSAIMYDGNEFYQSKEYEIRIVDRVGGGDSFAAGLIYGLINNKTPGDALEFAVAASALKHTVWGDFNIITLAEVENLLKGDISGRVQR
jgi:2-dehydro-3-deoxygluconokinase